jgi:hypothetical protein
MEQRQQPRLSSARRARAHVLRTKKKRIARPQSLGLDMQLHARSMFTVTLAAAFTFLAAPAHAQKLLIDDPLAGTTIGTLAGGRLTPEGYAPGQDFNNMKVMCPEEAIEECWHHNHILYRLPATVTDGAFEMEVKGIQNKSWPRDGEIGFLGMYNGRGIEEPIWYFNSFKFNFNRYCLAIRGQGKMYSAMNIAENIPSQVAQPRAVFLDLERGAGPNRWAGDLTSKIELTFDPAKWHKLRVEWRKTKFSTFVDGANVLEYTTGFPYNPDDHRVWLGSAPGHPHEAGPKFGPNLPTVVIRNFKLYSYDPNTPAYVPPAGAPARPALGSDAGAGTAPRDAAASQDAAAAAASEAGVPGTNARPDAAPVTTLPVPIPPPPVASADAAAPTGITPAPPSPPAAPPAGPATPAKAAGKSGGCSVAAIPGDSNHGAWLLALGLALAHRRLRGDRPTRGPSGEP